MSSISLSRDGDSVTMNSIAEAPDPLVTYSQSKPEQDIQPVSNINPRVSDQFQPVPNFNVNAIVDGDNAYVNARKLAEELIKPHSGGNDLTLDLSNMSGLSSYTVAPNQAEALSLTYNPGQRDWVNATLNLNVVTNTIGGSASETVASSSTTPNNGGSITLTNPSNSESVTLSKRLTVERTVGRPNSTIKPNPTGVNYIDKVRSATDVFEISGRLASNTARAEATTLVEDILGDPLGRDALSLSFDNNLYALDTYNVVASGSQSGRTTISASEKDMVDVQGLTLRVVTT